MDSLKEVYRSKEEILREGLTYDDVLLVPQLSDVKTRKEVDLSSRITKNLSFNLPIISANMDTVTEANMAIAMARCGGLGIIHRYLPTEDQVKEVLKVKRSEGLIVENPYCLGEDIILRDAKTLMKENNVSSVLIVDQDRRLKGMITQRDIWFEDNLNKALKELMTREIITAEPGIKLEEAKEFFRQHKIEKLPIVDKKGILHGLITSKDLHKRIQYPNATKDSKGRLLVGAAVGVVGDYLERTEALLDAGSDIIVIDIAHGHSTLELEAIKKIRKEFGDINLIGGNVATYEGAADLVNAGVDCVKVGVGPASICTTRIVTGSGVPQLSAIFDCSKVTYENDIPIIADGGIRTSGDIVKALAAGASSVMFGNLFAGTDESPGHFIMKDGKKMKVYRGMASFGANLGRRQLQDKKENVQINDVVPEGVEAYVPYRGSVYDMLYQLAGGVRSGLSYNGSSSIPELQKKAKFVKMSPHGLRESQAHGATDVTF
ncbi:MAG: IMP dehydrogenase [Nanoarchaeota archaeon]|mgnify:CR=1 FL=1